MTNEKIAVVQVAIHIITGKEVNINPPRNLTETLLLVSLYNLAYDFLSRNGIKLTPLDV